jgi:hypothetical protein
MADDDRKAFFTTLPGILSGIAALMVAATTLYFGLRDRAEKRQLTANVAPGSSTTGAPTTQTPATQPPAVSIETRRQQAEALAGEWLGAMREHDVDHLVRLAATPYYFDQEILVTRESIADKYRQLFTEKPTVPEGLQIQKIRARTVAEMKEEGASLQRDRIFGSLSLADSDWGIEVHLRTTGLGDEGMMMFAREVGDQLKIVGTWD